MGDLTEPGKAAKRTPVRIPERSYPGDQAGEERVLSPEFAQPMLALKLLFQLLGWKLVMAVPALPEQTKPLQSPH